MLESLFKKVAGLKGYNIIKKRLQHRLFPVTFAKFLRAPFFYKSPPVTASGDNKSHTLSKLFTLNKQTFSSKRVTFLRGCVYGERYIGKPI